MRTFLLQYVLITCLRADLEDLIMNLDVRIYQALTEPQSHLEEHLREDISELYMCLDNILENMTCGEEQALETAARLRAQGGLRVAQWRAEGEALAREVYNWTTQQQVEIEQAVNGTCYVWDCISRKLQQQE